jgi:LmbE family N-acetylglucosaminyl deacetylase
VSYRLAAVFAHPDDDTFGLAGTVAQGRGEVEYIVVVATSGEAGQISDPSLATRENLAEVREEEERHALRASGVDDARVHFLRYPDGGLKEVPRPKLIDDLTRVLKEALPHVVVTFGPEGITKHDDHITIGAAATEAFHQARAEATEGDPRGAFQRLLYVAIPSSELDRFWETLRAQGIDIGNPDDPLMPRGVPDQTITHRVDCSGVLKTKLEALRAHRTQREEVEQIPEELQAEMFGVEWFIQAFPPVTEPPGRPATSIFEGVKA